MSQEFKENSHAVQSHLSILQGVIQRMASNSSSCKAWCITLVSAMFVVIGDKGKPELLSVSYLPIVLFFCLDGYYLSLERAFRKSYNEFTTKLHKGQIEAFELFEIKSSGNPDKLFLKSLFTISVWPFYLTLLAMAVSIQLFVI